MDVREKLIELLWEYDQMRMMRMSIEECADRLIQKGLTVGKCKNDTKCSDLAICLDENAKEKTERIVDLMTSFYGVDPGYYGVEAYPLASHLIAHGVTVREWIPVTERLPEIGRKCLIANGEIVKIGWIRPDGVWKTGVRHNDLWGRFSLYPPTHWMPLPEPPKEV